jgi:hypothetical protein
MRFISAVGCPCGLLKGDVVQPVRMQMPVAKHNGRLLIMPCYLPSSETLTSSSSPATMTTLPSRLPRLRRHQLA